MYKHFINKYPGFWMLVMTITMVFIAAIILGRICYNHFIHEPYVRMEHQEITMFESEKQISNVKIISGNKGDAYHIDADGTSLIYILSDGIHKWKAKFLFNWDQFIVTKIDYIWLEETSK